VTQLPSFHNTKGIMVVNTPSLCGWEETGIWEVLLLGEGRYAPIEECMTSGVD